MPSPAEEAGEAEIHDDDGDPPDLVDEQEEEDQLIIEYREHLNRGVRGGGDRRVGSEYHACWLRSRSFAKAAESAIGWSDEPEVMDVDDPPVQLKSKEQRLEDAIGPDRMKLLKLLGVSSDIANSPCFESDGCFGPIVVEEDPAVMAIEDFVETDIILTLDSGCVDHLADMADMPGYACVLESSPGSRRGQNFVVGNGNKVRNEGQVRLQMAITDGSNQSLSSVFQVAEITRPLMSVSRICDQDLECLFTKTCAKVLKPNGEVVATFERDGGLYTSRMRLRAPRPTAVGPSGFARPER